MKDARHSLPLTEVMKIARFTSPLLDALRLSLPRRRLRHGRRLALLSRPNLHLKLYIKDPTVLSLSQKLCVAEPDATFPSSAEPCAPRSLTRPSVHPSPPMNFLRLPPTSPHSLSLAQTKLPIPCYSTFLALSWLFLFTSSIFPGLCIPFLPSRRHLLLFPSTKWESLSTLLLPSGLSLSPPAYQSFLNASFYPVYSSFWNLIPSSLPARPVSALDGLL